MAITAGPKIIKDNLVMYMDKDNTVRSWKGKPTTNIITNPIPENTSNWGRSGGTGSLSIGYENSVPHMIWTQTSYSSWGAYMYMNPSFSGTLDDTAQYTFSAEWKQENSNIANSGISYEIVQGNGQSAAYSIGNIPNYSTYIGDGWYRFEKTFTPSNTGVSSARNRFILSNQGSEVLTFKVRNVQFEQNNFRTPFVAGTRSNTEAFIDPLNGIVFNSSNLDNYNPDGSFDFDGDSDYIYVNTASEVPVLYHKNFSLEAWVKRDETGRHDEILGDYQYGWFSFRISNGNKVVLSLIDYIEGAYQYPGITGTTTINADEWYHVAITWVYGSESRVYVNGRLDKTDSESYGAGYTGSGRGPRYVGRTTTGAPNAGNERYFKGEIGMVKVYEDKALTANEVLTNFEASRDRYGV